MGAQGYWLNERRLTVYSRLCVAMYVVGLLFWLIARVWLAEAPITTLRNDFAGFWSVRHMVLQGRASEAYLPDLALSAEAAFVPEHEVSLPWFYPPQVFFLFAPLAALPYLPAFFLWTGGCLACLAWSLRALAPNTPALWLLLASPGLFWILRFGQTGVLAAALLGGGLYFMARGRPLLAGILIGLLTFKPHLGLLLPFALIAGKQWRVFAAATLTALGMATASTLAFGAEVWPRFFEAMEIAMALQSHGALPHNQMVSRYASLRVLGLSNEPALALQALLGLAVLAAVLGRDRGAHPVTGRRRRQPAAVRAGRQAVPRDGARGG